MAQHYEVKDGETLVIHGPANIIVKSGTVPIVGETPPPPEPEPEAERSRRR